MVVLDTDIVIDHLRRSSGQESLLIQIAKKVSKEELALSVVSVQELYEGKSSRTSAAEDYLLSVIAPLRILPYTYEIAQLAGCILRDHKKPIGFADAAIAATVLSYHAYLFTQNIKDYKDIDALRLFKQ